MMFKISVFSVSSAELIDTKQDQSQCTAVQLHERICADIKTVCTIGKDVDAKLSELIAYAKIRGVPRADVCKAMSDSGRWSKETVESMLSQEGSPYYTGGNGKGAGAKWSDETKRAFLRLYAVGIHGDGLSTAGKHAAKCKTLDDMRAVMTAQGIKFE